VLRCALKYMSTTIDRIPAALINADLDIPNWESIRTQLAERARAVDRTRIH